MPIDYRFNAPLSLYAIPALYFIAQYPHVAKMNLMKKCLGGKYPNVNPRSNIELCQKKEVSQADIEKMERMYAANLNGLENFPLHAISILAANVSGVDNCTLNIIAGGLIAARLFYNYVYINGTSRTVSGLRSLSWAATVGACVTLLIKSANRFNARLVSPKF
ncbi:hypothetical protein FRB94_002998 [Tulasnella sp. JGI-2019a]|nr:hypothetical protein FRB94_002998 [Tulasnella sp. JGI-2019a]KAG9027211.1 hypothetical protein FRB95_007998 [Tulasnella sp. JGI-2019a]